MNSQMSQLEKGISGLEKNLVSMDVQAFNAPSSYLQATLPL